MGRPPKTTNRVFINAVLWKVRTGAPWRDLPERFGPWKTIYSRFRRWALAGHFQAIFEALQVDVDDQWNAIDGSYVRAHQHSAGGKGGSSETLLAYLEEAVPRSSMRALMRKVARSKSK
jgi:transposase